MADQESGQQRPAGWKKDPSGRHFGRYWDGQQWTEHVVSAEKVQSIDPLPPRPEPSLFPDAPPPPPAAPSTPAAGAPTAVMPAAPTIRGPMPTAPGWTPNAARSRGPAPRPVDPYDPKGKGENKALTAIRGWPRWAKWTAGAAVTLVLVAAAAGGEDDDTPVSVVGQVETTLTVPVATTLAPTTVLATTIPPTTIPPTTQAPTTVTTPATTRATMAATAPPATPAPTAPATTRQSSVYYANCTAVRAAGAAPIYRGQPGYAPHLDRDDDGIGCET